MKIKTIKELEAEIKEPERHWKLPNENPWTPMIIKGWQDDRRLQIQTLKDVLELINEVDDEHLIHFRNKVPPNYVSGWVEACERVQEKIIGKEDEEIKEKFIK